MSEPRVVPEVDVVDSTWIGAPPSVVAAAIADATRWRHWWPDLDLQLTEYRGPKGVRWTVRSAEHGRLTGSMEVWIEPVDDGVVAHYFLRLHVIGGSVSVREADRLVHHYRTQAKQVMWGLSDKLDPGRIARVSTPPGR